MLWAFQPNHFPLFVVTLPVFFCVVNMPITPWSRLLWEFLHLWRQWITNPPFDYQEDEAAVPSMWAYLCWCRGVCRQVDFSPDVRTCQLAPGPHAGLDKRRGCQLLFQVTLRKLTPRYVGSYDVDWMVNGPVVCLKLPARTQPAT